MHATPLSLWSFLQQNVWQITTIFILFTLANVAIYSFSPPGSYLSWDTAGYIEPAKRLVEEGVYRSETRLPGYPIFIAVFMLFTDSIGGFVVAAQSIMLFAIAIMIGVLAERIRPDSGMPALVLICFSPSALFYAQKMLPDVLFTFLFITYIYFLVQSYMRGSVYSAIVVGVAAGLAAIIRGNGHYLIFLIPIVFVFGYRLANIHWPEKRNIYVMLVAVVAAILVLGPWLYINAKERNELSFISNSYRNYVIHDNIIMAVARGKGMSKDQATNAIYLEYMQREDITAEEWELLDRSDKHEVVVKNSRQIMADLSPKELIVAMSKALTTFFMTSEGRGWSQLFQQDLDNRIKRTDAYKFSLAATLKHDPAVSITTSSLHFLTLAFNVLVYSLFLVGLIYLLRIKAWDKLFVISMFIILFAGTAGFIGYSRYRLPVEPLIICLASVGIPGVTHWLLSRRVSPR